MDTEVLEIVEHLRRLRLFAECTRAELDEIANAVHWREVTEGTMLTAEGAPASELFVILEGVAGVYRRGRRVGTVGPGDFFGELAAIDGRARAASVVARTPMRLLAAPSSAMSALLQRTGVAQSILEQVVARIRREDDDELVSPPPAAPPRSRSDEPAGGWDAVTPAEQRVIDLVATGFSNSEAAEELFLSRYTVESHLKSVYLKLGISSRAALAAEVARRRA